MPIIELVCKPFGRCASSAIRPAAGARDGPKLPLRTTFLMHSLTHLLRVLTIIKQNSSDRICSVFRSDLYAIVYMILKKCIRIMGWVKYYVFAMNGFAWASEDLAFFIATKLILDSKKIGIMRPRKL